VLGLIVENVVRAIGRGFSPEHAMRLFKDDMDFFIFNLHDYVGKKDSHTKRIKSRMQCAYLRTTWIFLSLTSMIMSEKKAHTP